MKKTLFLFVLVCASQCVFAYAAEELDWKPSAEQIDAAKELVADLGVVLKEDDTGAVVLLDTAAKRSWVNDQQMQAMLMFPRLQTLTVEGPSISDRLAPNIARQAALTSLAMRNTLISDKGLEWLSALEQLKSLTLRDIAATCAPLGSLPHPDKLRSLNVAQSGITDKQIVFLAKMTGLEKLILSETALTDAAVDVLSGMKKLKYIEVTQTRISAAGIARLRVAIPDCTIRAD